MKHDNTAIRAAMAALPEELGTSWALDRVESLEGQVSPEEWQARVDLAACYRLVAQFGWDDMLSVHISARVPGEEGKFLINPYGLLFSQVTASSLIKVDSEGTKYSETPFHLNTAAINIHGGILDVRPDVASVLHLHTNAGVAVSTMKDGLLPINQRSLYFLPMLAYHDYEGIAIVDDERISLARDLGDKWVMILRNHGTLTVGRSIGQAFVYAYFLERACQYQVETLSMGAELVPLSQETIDIVPTQIGHFEFAGRLEWPALVATLDAKDSSFRN